jgi:DNA polymerase III alpha subunit
MAERQNTDKYGRTVTSEQMICDQLYQNSNFDYSQVELENSSKYNSAVDSLYLDWPKLKNLESIGIDPVAFHRQNQSTWFMPEEYKTMNIAKWLLDQCKNETELQRTAEELLLYAEYDLIDLLCYLKYLVDTMRSNNIVWGVGRGSSVASFVLYLIGVHKINSIFYNLDIKEFIR